MACRERFDGPVSGACRLCPGAAATTFWWPWVKNYSGELTVGYFDATWPQWVWYDQTLKKSKGY